VFSKVIEINDWIGDKIGGRQIESVVSEMPSDGRVFWPGGQVIDKHVLGEVGVRTFEGQAGLDAIVLNRMAAAPEPPLRRSSSDRSLNIDERLRRLGIGVADR
jgi:hypothetical protein